MKLKNRLMIIDILIVLAVCAIPLAVLGGCGVIPVGAKCILFYVVLGLAIITHEFWAISTYLKGGFQEDSILFLRFKLSFLILLLPFVNLGLYYIPFNGDAEKWYWIIGVILDALALIGFFVVFLLTGHVSDKMAKSLQAHKSERIEPVAPQSYETDEGDFAGSNARRK